MKIHRSLIAIATLALAATAHAAAITNTDIVKMTAAGLSPDLIVSSIRGASEKHFDTSTDAIIALKNAKVDDTVVKEILAQTNQDAARPILTAADWAKVTLTKNPEDVKGLKKLGQVRGNAARIFGSPPALRTKAGDAMKKDAARQGASIVLVETDDFQATPINNVSMEGTAYQ